MVPKIIARGRSFKGAASYLLHDKGHAPTSDRVAWTDTRNLAIEDPHQAWRIMAATALDQDRLKEEAGIKATGRKSDRAVLHLSLSWHPDEKDALTPEEMKRAARGALRALGADDRQALIIAHNDEAHPHVHILCNRVSPDDGRMLSSSKERLALSSWAEAYEKERGAILCDERVLNNEARDAGIYTRGEKPKSRQEVEERSQLGGANDNYERVARFYAEQRTQDAGLGAEKRALAAHHQAQWASLRERKSERVERIVKTQARALRRAQEVLNKRSKTVRRDLLQKQTHQRHAFEKREERILGRVQNAFQLISLPDHVRGEAEGKPLTNAFGLLASSGQRRQVLERQHRAERAEMIRQLKKRRRDVKRRLQRIADTGREKLDRQTSEQSSTLRFTQAGERGALKAKFRKRRLERDREFSAFRSAYEKALAAEAAFGIAGAGADARGEAEQLRNMQQLIKAKLDREKSRGDRER